METNLKIQQIIALLENHNIQQKAILSFQEALAYLDVSKSFLYKLTSSNSITFFKPSGKLIYFKKTDLDNWLLQNEFQQSSIIDEDLNNYLNRKSYGEKYCSRFPKGFQIREYPNLKTLKNGE